MQKKIFLFLCLLGTASPVFCSHSSMQMDPFSHSHAWQGCRYHHKQELRRIFCQMREMQHNQPQMQKKQEEEEEPLSVEPEHITLGKE